jgi:transposase-like protein
MAQHFLLSAKARTLSLRTIYAGGEDKAYATFKAIRWGATNGEPVCSRCGCCDSYDIAKRRQFQCKGCGYRYSVTSGTIFASRKMAFVDLLAAICIFTNAVKGISSLQMGRDLDCQQKTAFVLCHKLREAMAAEVEGETLDDVVEIDGAYFGGHVRPANLKEDRVDRRKAENQSGTRRVVVVLRQRGGRTLPFVAKTEGEGVKIARRVVAPTAVMQADEAAHWDALHASWKTFRINHSQAYSFDGACTNQAESYFSRLRRMVTGQHHGVSPRHLSQYAHEAAWKEDHRRGDNGALAMRALGLGLAHGVSRDWKGYWQR